MCHGYKCVAWTLSLLKVYHTPWDSSIKLNTLSLVYSFVSEMCSLCASLAILELTVWMRLASRSPASVSRVSALRVSGHNVILKYFKHSLRPENSQLVYIMTCGTHYVTTQFIWRYASKKLFSDNQNTWVFPSLPLLFMWMVNHESYQNQRILQ